MQHPDYNSPAALKSFLDQNEMAMQKKFGQNFMINEDARKKIVSSMEISNNMNVWEIGPGLGCMSEEILKNQANLTVFEIDRGFVSLLHQFFEQQESNGSFRIIEGDVLKNWKKYANEKKIDRLIGNLPYNIAATFIADTITANVVFDKCVFTVQKEVADRMIALPGSDNYSAYSVLCQLYYNVKTTITLAPGNFWPKPNVASTVVIMTKKSNLPKCSDYNCFVRLVHALFSSRRKTIRNNIKSILPPGLDADSFFEQSKIASSLRAEDLSLEQFLLLSEVLSSAIIKNQGTYDRQSNKD